MEKREKFASRLGFLLISAGCAIGIGNVWRFPYITGQYGGAAFVLIYLFFLVVLGLPIMAMEFAVGRASRKSCAVSFRVLEPAGTKWHWYAWLGMAGNYLLMMFYTTVAGWMLAYVVKMLRGAFTGASAEAVGGIFNDMLAQPGPQIFWMIVAVVLGFGVCSLGLQNGVEKITKAMMVCLLLLMVALAVRSVTLPGAERRPQILSCTGFRAPCGARAWAMWCTRPWDRPFSRCLWASAPWPFSAATSARSAR